MNKRDKRGNSLTEIKKEGQEEKRGKEGKRDGRRNGLKHVYIIQGNVALRPCRNQNHLIS